MEQQGRISPEGAKETVCTLIAKMFVQVSDAISFLWRDPLPVIGLLMIGASAVLAFRLEIKLQEVGATPTASIRNRIFTVPRAYLRQGLDRGWSPWPAYLVWLFAGLGALLLIVGLFRL